MLWSGSPRITNGWFKVHISYIGITNIIKNVTVIRISAVSSVSTCKGETYVISQGATRSKVTPKKANQVVIAFNVFDAIVRYSTWTMIIKTTGRVNK